MNPNSRVEASTIALRFSCWKQPGGFVRDLLSATSKKRYRRAFLLYFDAFGLEAAYSNRFAGDLRLRVGEAATFACCELICIIFLSMLVEMFGTAIISSVFPCQKRTKAFLASIARTSCIAF